MASPSSSGLNVIALVSGGKDSFFSLLHCEAHGHRIVALANLHPATRQDEERARPSAAATDDSTSTSNSDGVAGVRPSSSTGVVDIGLAGHNPREAGQDGSEVVDDEDEADLNSFMYQTVGHTVIPLYAAATGIPLYRQPILGGAVQSARDYAPSEAAEEDETESMIPLLRHVMAQHPEANAVSAGAILSTYQRTRVESVALRLGLTPLAYLWKFPILPSPSSDDAQLLVDMAAAGLDARIIKVASGGLDDLFLWENLAAPSTVARVKHAMGRFGTSEKGAVLGEGGEFETLVVDGPRRLFKKQIVVQEDDKSIVKEGGGAAWVRVRKAQVSDKPMSSPNAATEGGDVRIPELLDERFRALLDGLPDRELPSEVASVPSARYGPLGQSTSERLAQWCFVSDATGHTPSIEAETASLMDSLRDRLQSQSLSPSSIISSVIILRHMSDFPTINKIYSAPFAAPNPPSRVTYSCGELLPPGRNILIYALVHTALKTDDRQGLHVQSRSYWAPANIGPYSQAVTIPSSGLLESGAQGAESSSTRLVTIAGQIPLIPATMDLPRGPDAFKMQVVLSLQHLWRIGLEMGVQWWSSAVAYFPRGSASDLPMAEKAQIAAKAWVGSHAPASNAEDEDEDMETGPDLWDRKFNPQYMYLGTGEGKADSAPQLPDWSVVSKPSTDDSTQPPPFFFAAEVEELPRQAGVEWQAHIGFSHVNAPSVHVYNSQRPGVISSTYQWNIQHCVLDISGGLVVQTALAVEIVDESSKDQLPPLPDMIREVHEQLVQDMCNMVKGQSTDSLEDSTPYQLYVPTSAFRQNLIDEELVGKGSPIIPCFSIRNARGGSLGLVALFRNVFTFDK